MDEFLLWFVKSYMRWYSHANGYYFMTITYGVFALILIGIIGYDIYKFYNIRHYLSLKSFLKFNKSVNEKNCYLFYSKVVRFMPKVQRQQWKDFLQSNRDYVSHSVWITFEEYFERTCQRNKKLISFLIRVITANIIVYLIFDVSKFYILYSIMIMILLSVAIFLIDLAINYFLGAYHIRCGKELCDMFRKNVEIGRKEKSYLDLSNLDLPLKKNTQTTVTALVGELENFILSSPNPSIAKIVYEGLSNCSFGKLITESEQTEFQDVLNRLKMFCI